MTRNCKNLEPRRRRAVLVSGKGGWRSAGRLRTGPPPGRLRLARCLPTGPGEPSGFQVARLGAGGLEGEATGPAASSPRSLERHPGEPQAGIRGPWGVGQGAAGCGRCGVTSGLSCRCQWQAGLRGPRPLEARGSDTGNLTQTEARAPRAGPLLGSDQGASALMAYQASLSHVRVPWDPAFQVPGAVSRASSGAALTEAHAAPPPGCPTLRLTRIRGLLEGSEGHRQCSVSRARC